MSRLPPLSRLAASSAGVRGAELSPSPVAEERGRDRPAAPPAEGWGVGGRGKEGRGLPGAERAAVEREQEPSLPRLPGECESPGSPAGLGGSGAVVGAQAAGAARPPLRIPGAPRERRHGRGGPRAVCGDPWPGGALPPPPAPSPAGRGGGEPRLAAVRGGDSGT